MKRILLPLLLLILGCETPKPAAPYQRFILVPHPSVINADIPDGGLALDTKTGQLCYTVGGAYTSGFPAMDMCVDVLKNHPD